MYNKIKNIVSKTDLFLFKLFGSEKNVKFLENLKEAKELFSYLNQIGEENKVKFVGGCVRKVLSAEIVDDIDLATTLEPNEVKKKLNKKNIKVIDTGISHGTVTAILNQIKFEITTLRKDVSTDGRHADVKFTTNWEQDALRRDFTINAIYADLDGRFFDPQNGISDLKNGKIKFIGSPDDRIQEDYLRILRYFRFFTQYSKKEHDQEVMQSIKKNVNGINKISKERIFDELKKIFSLKNVTQLFNLKESREIFLNIFPQLKYYERLKKLNNKLKDKFDSTLIMASLIVDQSDNYGYFCYKYKTSNVIKKRFENISNNFENLKKKEFYSEKNIKKMTYFIGKDNVRDLLLFSALINNKINDSDIIKLLDYVNFLKVPKFPLSGDDLKKFGYESGEIMGKKLKLLEEEWIENNFILDDKTLKKNLNKFNKN
tara:strand:- start:1849 stop:3138 length:1290 start_codon:yes stop_codon:yes gene_type:complete